MFSFQQSSYSASIGYLLVQTILYLNDTHPQFETFNYVMLGK